MSANNEDPFWVLEENNAFIARKMSGRSFREKEKERQQAKRAVINEVASNPFEKVALAGRPIWPKKNGIPTTRRVRKKRTSKFQYPYDGNKGYPLYDNGKGKGAISFHLAHAVHMRHEMQSSLVLCWI